MTVTIINPTNGQPLVQAGNHLTDAAGNIFPVINGVPRIAELDNYTENFGVQWNKFARTQLDREDDRLNISRSRFFAEALWDSADMSGKNSLQFGSDVGGLTKVALEQTKAALNSAVYSDAATGRPHPRRHHPRRSASGIAADGRRRDSILRHARPHALSRKARAGQAKGRRAFFKWIYEPPNWKASD